ncbi:MAG TPA: DUF1254 domain-containing protein [Synechococcales cyanobacterium M55_K2018_004]|nr:DUF1254 domain-containing protein [Synechococcales cyanobacterium M55_K2018_004]
MIPRFTSLNWLPTKAIDTFVITPNTDTPYFYLWVDLSMQSPLL